MRSNLIPVVPLSFIHSIHYVPDFLLAQYLDGLPDIEIEAEIPLGGEFVGYPDLLSSEWYGTTEFWWVICMVNGIIDPLVDMVEGMRLKQPSYQAVQQLMSLGNTSSSKPIGSSVVL